MDKFDKEAWNKPAKKFKALGHPLRLWIAMELAKEEHCVQELVELTSFDFSTVSQHVAILKEADVLVDEKRGKHVFYNLKCECVRKFLECIAENRSKRSCEK